MTSEGVQVDQAWGGLVDLPEADRQARMAQRYTELASLPEGERTGRMLAMARAEYALSEEKLRVFTTSRLNVWLHTLPVDTAKRIASSYEAAMRMMPGPAAMRRVALVQTLARNFSAEDEAKLSELSPNVFAGVPPRVAALVFGGGAKPAGAGAPEAPAQPVKKGGWWPFGKK